MKRIAIFSLMIAFALLVALPVDQASAQSRSSVIHKTDTTKASFHSIGYAIGADQRCDLYLAVPNATITTSYVSFAFCDDSGIADTTNPVRVYQGAEPYVLQGVRLDSMYVKGSATGVTFDITAIKK